MKYPKSKVKLIYCMNINKKLTNIWMIDIFKLMIMNDCYMLIIKQSCLRSIDSYGDMVTFVGV